MENLHSANKKINPILRELKEKTFFRLFKANLEAECPFWVEKMLCASNKCGVCECDEKEVPKEWENSSKNNQSSIFNSDNANNIVNKELHSAESISIGSNGAFTEADWMANEERDKEALYINLLDNSEAYTAYQGKSIWKAIYEENCFE